MNKRQFLKYVNDPLSIVARFAVMKPERIIDDEKYLKLYYRKSFHRKLDLENPKTYSEKLQWLKLYYHCPEYTKMVDKYAAKQYVSDIIGEEYVIPTFAAWDSTEQIEWDKLPNQFVLKTTHDSGGVVVCKDKEKLDKEVAIKKLNWALTHDNYTQTREWPYKNVRRRIIAEQFMEDEFGELRDYKFLCFDGEPKIMFVACDRGRKDKGDTKFDFFDMDFNHLPLIQGHPNSPNHISKPEGFEKMKELARLLSAGKPHVRVDFYHIHGKVYFGELTFFHFSGFCPFEPEEWDYKLGSWLTLPPKIV